MYARCRSRDCTPCTRFPTRTHILKHGCPVQYCYPTMRACLVAAQVTCRTEDEAMSVARKAAGATASQLRRRRLSDSWRQRLKSFMPLYKEAHGVDSVGTRLYVIYTATLVPPRSQLNRWVLLSQNVRLEHGGGMWVQLPFAISFSFLSLPHFPTPWQAPDPHNPLGHTALSLSVCSPRHPGGAPR